MKLTVDFTNVIYPVIGAWKPAPGLTEHVQCGNIMCDAMTGEGEFQCENWVWINPEWVMAHERLWPVQRPGVLCPDCAP